MLLKGFKIEDVASKSAMEFSLMAGWVVLDVGNAQRRAKDETSFSSATHKMQSVEFPTSST